MATGFAIFPVPATGMISSPVSYPQNNVPFEQVVDISNRIQVQEKCAGLIVANPYFFVDIFQTGEYLVSMYYIHI